MRIFLGTKDITDRTLEYKSSPLLDDISIDFDVGEGLYTIIMLEKSTGYIHSFIINMNLISGYTGNTLVSREPPNDFGTYRVYVFRQSEGIDPKLIEIAGRFSFPILEFAEDWKLESVEEEEFTVKQSFQSVLQKALEDAGAGKEK